MPKRETEIIREIRHRTFPAASSRVRLGDGGSLVTSYDETHRWIQYETLLVTGTVKTSYSAMDTLGRVYRTGAYNGSTDDLTDTCYDAQGHVRRVAHFRAIRKSKGAPLIPLFGLSGLTAGSISRKRLKNDVLSS